MSAENNALGIYLNKFQDWKYCPPSDHLWTVTFLLAPRENNVTASTFKKLYENILTVNKHYEYAFSPLWNVKTPKGDGDFVLNAQDASIGLFLATEINFNANSIIIQDNSSNLIQGYTGWLSYGKTLNGRNHNHAAKIQFAQTNWNFIEIFIDRWIAAIGQQGLIEDSSLPNIKANIIISEYSASVPFPEKAGVWIPRKRITLLKAFPKNRQETKFSYNTDEAGAMKYNIVDFEFDAYQVEYLDVGITKTKQESKGTPGWVTPSTAVGTSIVGPTLTKEDIEKLYPDSK